MMTIRDNPWLRSLVITGVVVSLLMVTGCSGCQQGKDDEKVTKKENKKKKPKDPFETNTPVLLPGVFPKPLKTRQEREEEEREDPLQNAINSLGGTRTRNNKTKLGHWYTANFQAIANNFNADGQLTAHSVDGASRPVPIPATDYYLSTSRPVSLPKGEWKNFETNVYLPPRNKRVTSAMVNYSMNRSSSGLAQIVLAQPTSLMKPFQYHIVLMSNRPDTYSFLNLADCIRLRGQLANGEVIDPFYYIVPTIPDDPIPLPQHSLNWTTIAYLIWDDYDPDSLAPQHQEAILDWLHFGGQLIISGPDCLDKLQTSFLADYLPAHFDGSRNLTNADLDELNRNWTVPATRNAAQKRVFQISDKVPLLGITFKPHDDAQFIKGTGEIAIERQIGRGRIAITAFSLNAPSVRKWRSFKSFFNGALLRKPARRFGKSNSEDTLFEWASDSTSLFDPMIHSTLRYLSRDLSRNGTTRSQTHQQIEDVDEDANPSVFAPVNSQYTDGSELRLQQSKYGELKRNFNDTWHYGGFEDAPQSGTGGWNDNSGVSFAARETLKEAAGISPPSSDFVLKMLAVYLIVLVPVNWLIFRMIGRVEYAWIAAPLIAISGALLVVKMAALDIGFVRSNTQIGLLEIHADYRRAHLAEYSALYTSLSTRYNAELDNLSAQSLPFGTVDANQQFVSKESISEVKLRRTVSNSLEGFQVQSNSTGLLHTEYMLDLAGVISFIPGSTDQTATVTNSTNINIRDAAVVGRNDQGELLFSWIGDLEAGRDAELKFDSRNNESIGDSWYAKPGFQNTQRASADIWSKNLSTARSASFEQINSFPELQSIWPRFERLLLQTQPAMEKNYSRKQFDDIFLVVNGNSNVSLGRLLDTVLKNLSLNTNEYRLIGATDQELGHTAFDPGSTQVDQLTLIVAHLQQPQLPLASPDLNAYEDFVTRSNLDWEREDKEFEELMKKNAELEMEDTEQKEEDD